MDTYTKGVMTVIAIALVSISFQLSDTKPIKTAHSNPTKTLEERVTTLEDQIQKINKYVTLTRHKLHYH